MKIKKVAAKTHQRTYYNYHSLKVENITKDEMADTWKMNYTAKLQNNIPQHLLESRQKFALLCWVWELIIGPFNALLLAYAVHSKTIFYFLSW